MRLGARVACGLAVLGLLAAAPTAQAAQRAPLKVFWWTGSVSLTAGKKGVPSLGAQHEKQDLLGLRVTFGRNTWPVAAAVDVEYSEGGRDPAGRRMEMWEWRVGVRKAYGGGVLHPFWGAGLALTRLRVEDTAPPAVGRYGPDPGYWVSAGANLDITRGSHLGVSWVHTETGVDTAGATVDRSDGFRLYWGKRW